MEESSSVRTLNRNDTDCEFWNTTNNLYGINPETNPTINSTQTRKIVIITNGKSI